MNKKIAAALIALAVIAAPAVMTESYALSLSGVLGNVVKKTEKKAPKQEMPPTGEVVYGGGEPLVKTEKEFQGYVYLPDGSPAMQCNILGTENLIYRIYKGKIQIRSATDSPSSAMGWSGDDKNPGHFEIGAPIGRTYTFICFQEGYKPVILKNITMPAKMDVHLTEPDDTITGIGFVNYFPEEDAVPY